MTGYKAGYCGRTACLLAHGPDSDPKETIPIEQLQLWFDVWNHAREKEPSCVEAITKHWGDQEQLYAHNDSTGAKQQES